MDTSHSALARLHQLAQAEASRLHGDGPVAHWKASAPTFDAASAWSVVAGCAGLILLVAAGWAAVVWSSADEGRATQEWPVGQVYEPLPTVSSPPASNDGSALHRAAAATRSLTIDRAGPDWRIDARNVSRADAVIELARVSATQLFGAEFLPAQSRPLDLHWQGRDLATAFRAVIGDEFGYALQCDGARCRAWIFRGQVDSDGVRPRLMTHSAPAVVLSLVAVEVPDPHDRSAHD